MGGLHFLSFLPFGPSFPFILAFWAFISFHFCLLGLHLAFWPCSGYLLGPPHKLPKIDRFLITHTKNLSAAWPNQVSNFWPFELFSFHFGLLGLHFPSFWPFEPLFPFVFALWAFISLHFGLVGIHLSFLPFGPSFPCVLASGPSSSLMMFSFAPFF